MAGAAVPAWIVAPIATELPARYPVGSFTGGDMASTWVTKPEVHAEVRVTS